MKALGSHDNLSIPISGYAVKAVVFPNRLHNMIRLDGIAGRPDVLKQRSGDRHEQGRVGNVRPMLNFTLKLRHALTSFDDEQLIKQQTHPFDT